MKTPVQLPKDRDRVVVWFSCGAASAVATHLTLEKYDFYLPVEIVYTDPGFEHEDNYRFLEDCAKWFGQEIKILKSKDYRDIYDVFEKTRFLVGPGGARCTTELKKKVRQQFERVWADIQVFGFDITEQSRAERFRQNNPEVYLETPLIDAGFTKKDCFQALRRAGIELPAMYKLGYKNNNCIGCVKGQAGYWNKIRKDFPNVFNRMAEMEERLGVAINKSYAGDGKRKRVFLKDLPPDAGRYEQEPSWECGVLCQLPEE